LEAADVGAGEIVDEIKPPLGGFCQSGWGIVVASG